MTIRKLLTVAFATLLLVGCSSPEDVAQEAAKKYLEQEHQQNGGGSKYELISIDTKLDMIPEYFTDEILGQAGNQAAIAISHLRNGSPTTMYCIGQGNMGGAYYTEEHAINAIANLEQELATLKRNSSPVEAYVTCVVEKIETRDGFEKTYKQVIASDKNDPSKVLKAYDFYGSEEYLAAIKIVQAQGTLKTDPFGKVSTEGWYNVEKFILSDRLEQGNFLGIGR